MEGSAVVTTHEAVVAPAPRRIGRRARMAAAGALLAVSLVATLSQGGLLVPKFDANSGGGTGTYTGSGGGTGGSYSTSSNLVQNVSWRSWTVTGVHLTDIGSAVPTDVKVIQVGVRRTDYQLGVHGPGRSLPRLTVAPGQEFDVVLVEKQDDCPAPPPIHTEAQAQRWLNSPRQHMHSIPAAITVKTPLGTRSVPTAFTVSCGI